MDMGGGPTYSDFGSGSSPSSGASVSTIKYLNLNSDLSYQHTGQGRKTPQVSGYPYSGFNIVLYNPSPLPDPTGLGEVCPGEQDYCIDYTPGYFYNWSIIEGSEYARFVTDSTQHCVTVLFTNQTNETRQVVLRVEVSPPCCPSYGYKDVYVDVLPNVHIDNHSPDIVVCEGDPFTLFVHSTMSYPMATYQWLLNGNAINGRPMSDYQSTSYYGVTSAGVVDTGTYVVLVSSYCNVDTTSIHVSMYDQPVVTVSMSEDVLCAGPLPLILNSNMDDVVATIVVHDGSSVDTFTFHLHAGENEYDELYPQYGNDFSINMYHNGYITVLLAASSQTGCTNTQPQSTIVILANSDEAIFAGADRTYCSRTFNLEAMMPNSGHGQWSLVATNPAGATVHIDNPSEYRTSVTVDQEGDYTFEWSLEMTSPCYSVIRDTVVISVRDSLEIHFPTPPTSCYGELADADVTVSGGEEPYSIYWMYQGDIIGTGDHYSGLQVGLTYYVVVDDTNECSTIDSFQVSLLPSHVIEIQEIDTVCPNATSVELTVGITDGVQPFTAIYTYAGNDYPSGEINGQTYSTTLPLAHHPCNGKDMVYLSITDANGCTAYDTLVFDIADIRGPVIVGSIPNDTVTCWNAIPDAVISVTALRDMLEGTDAGITDNCYEIGDLSLSSVTDTVADSCRQVVMRTYTVTDPCDNPAQVTHTIVMRDTVPPVVNGTLPDIEIRCLSELPDEVSTMDELLGLLGSGASITDNCFQEFELSVVTELISAVCHATYHRTYTVTDRCGNPTDIIQNIIFNDNTPPVISGDLANDTIYANANCQYTVPAAFTTVSQLTAQNLTITDCNLVEEVSFADDNTDDLNLCSKQITRTYTVSDSCGNTATITQTIVVLDTIAPSVTTTLQPAYTYYSYNSPDCEYDEVPKLQQNNFDIDDCNEVTMTVSHRDTVRGSTTCEWSYVRVYSFEDACGNGPTEVTQTIIVKDTTRPAVTDNLNDTILYYSGNVCTLAEFPALTLNDFTYQDCNEVTLEVTYSDTTNEGRGCEWSYRRVYTFTDVCNNASVSIDQLITVRDTTRPAVVDNLNDTTVYYSGNDCTLAEFPALTLDDFTYQDCNEVTLEVTHSDTTNEGRGCEWSYRRVYTFTDVCNNASVSIDQTITVKDTTRPVVLDNLTDTILYYSGSNCDLDDYPVLGLSDFTVTDCSPVTLTVTADTTNGGAGCSWTITRVYTFTDACGNAPVSIDQLITVQDTTRPAISGTLSDRVIYSLDDCTFHYPDTLDIARLQDSLTITDCNLRDSVAIVHSDYEEDGICGGHFIRTYKIFDQCGNYNTVQQTIMVTDTTRPYFTEEIPAQMLVSINCEFVIPDLTDTVLSRVMDNCTASADIEVTDQTPVAGTTATSEQDVVVTVSDLCGNTNTITIHVTLPDTLRIAINQNDTAICEGQSVTLPTTVSGGVADYTFAWAPAAGLDNSSASAPVATPTDTTVYVVTVTDQNGCTATDTVTINVDTIPDKPELSSEPNVACHGGDANGSITIESPVPAGWYNYSLEGADFQDTTNRYEGLLQGLYTVTVTTDASSHCSASDTITVENSPAIPAVVVNPLSDDIVLCPNHGTQEVTATIQSGLAPFTVTWEGATISDDYDTVATVAIDAAVCDSTYSVTVRIVDHNECDAHNTYTFRVVDTLAPVLVGRIDTARMEGCSADEVEARYPLAMTEEALRNLGINIMDSCTRPGDFEVYSVSDTTGSCPIVVTRRYTVTDLCGNVSDTVRQVILVHDSIAPVVTVAMVTTELNACGVSAAPSVAENAEDLQDIGFAFADACTADALLTVAVSADTSVTDCPKVITRHYTVTDECGNTSDEMTHIISIFDSVAPVISDTAENLELYACDTTILSGYLAASTVEQLVNLGFTIEEQCSYDEMEVHHTVDSVNSCPIVITRTYWLTDACGNASNRVTHRIAIDDTTHPVWNEAITDTLLVSGNCRFVMPDFEAMAEGSSTDNCSSITFMQSVPAGTEVTSATTVTLTLTDVCGNDTTYTIAVTLPDTLRIAINQSDTAICEGQSVDLPTTVSGGVEVSSYAWTPSAGLDDATAAIVTAMPTDTTVYVVTVTDGNGCTATDTVTINVDTIPQTPVLSQLPNVACHGGDANGSITIESPGPAGWYNYSLNGAGLQDTTNLYGGLLQGLYTVTVTTDASSHCSATDTITVGNSPAMPSVVVNPLADDILLCPNQGTQVVTATIQSGLAPFTVTWEGATISDDYDTVATVAIDAAVCDSTYSVTVTIVDGNDCDAHNTYTFRVVDTLAPVLTGRIDTVRLEGCTADMVGDTLPLATTETALTALGITIADSCTRPGSFIVSSVSDTTGSCPIVVTRRYTVTDLCGNVSDTVRQVILVNDETAPTVSTEPIDTLIQGCDATAATAEATTVAELETIGFAINDACTPDERLTVRVKADTADRCPTVITRKYVVEDECHNVSDTMTHILRIKDTTAPVVNGTLSEVEVEGCSYDALGEYPIATTWAQLSGASYSNGISLTEACTAPEELEVRCLETQSGTCPTVVTRKYVLEDGCGNISDTLVHVLRFDDQTDPYFTQIISNQVLVSENCIFVMPNLTDTIRRYIADNCTETSNILIEQSIHADMVLTETQTVTITITDACNHSHDTTLTVEVPQTLTIAVMQGDTAVCDGASVTLPTTVTGGVAPYHYAWTPTDGLSSATEATVTATPSAGTYPYVVTVTDTNGCTATAGMTLTVDTLPANPVLSKEPNTICDGPQNGSITVESPTGEGYSYSLNNAGYQDTTTTYSNLWTGDYTVSVMTAEGCVSQPVSITVESSETLPRVTIVHMDALICPNAGSQTMTATVTGGTGPFQYTWTGTQPSDSLSAIVDINPAVCDSAYGISLQVVDANNCTSTSSDTLFVRDTTLPIISGTWDTITYNGCAVEDAPAAVTTLAGLTALGLTYSDNCTELMDEVGVRQEEEGSCPIVIRRYYTITDACHLTSVEYPYVLQVFDSVAPQVTNNEVVTRLNACDETSAPAVVETAEDLQAVGFTFSDRCTADENLTVSVIADTTETSCPKVITRRYTVTDACGNVSDTMTHIITLFDSIRPVINNEILPLTIDGCDTTVLRDYPIATIADSLEALGFQIEEACSEVTVHYSQTVVFDCPIVVTRTYSVEDACGNVSDSVTQVINIQDTTRPDFGTTLSDSLLVSNNCEFVVPDYVGIVMNTLTDNCTPPEQLVVSQSPVANEAVLSDTVVMITATDACNNTDTMFVRILLPTKPHLSVNLMDSAICQGSGVDIVASVENGIAPIVYAWTETPANTIEDTTASTITVAPEAVGVYTYSVMVTDDNGCSDTIRNITVTVHETPDTAVTTTTVNTVCDGTPNGTITVTSPTSETGYYLYSLDGGEYQTSPVFEHLSANDYQLTVRTTDGCLSETVTVTVGTSDDVPSVRITAETEVLCPIAGNQNVTAVIQGGEGPYVYQWHGDVVDADDENAVVAINDRVCDSVYTFSVSIRDVNNCVDTARGMITVLDHTAPSVTGIADTSHLYGCTVADAPAVLPVVDSLFSIGYMVDENCDNVEDLTLIHVATAIADGCPIFITRTYVLVDACGNVSDSIREYIIIEDTTAPAVDDVLQTVWKYGCTAEYAPDEAQTVADLVEIGFYVEDECGANMELSVKADTSNAICPLTITRRYTLSDRCGNTSDTLTHIIHIYDSVAPVITGRIDTVTLDGCNLSALDGYPMAETVGELLLLSNTLSIEEECTSQNSLVLIATQDSASTCPIIVTRTYKVKDECGNISDSITQVFEIQDTTRPQFNVAFADSILTGTDCHFFVPNYVSLVRETMTDNCTDVADIEISQTPAAGLEVTANTEVVITIEDDCHNVNTMAVQILLPSTPTVAIAQNDTAFCEGGSVVLPAIAENGTPDYSYTWDPGTGLSGTDDATVTASPAAGSYTYTVTVRDANGCTVSDAVTVTAYAVPDAAVTETTPNTLCTGGYNGTITVTSPVGSEYQYSLDGGDYQSEVLFDSLQQNTYTILVRTDEGCISEPATAVVGITQDMPAVSINAADSVLCPNDGPQTATAVITGGHAPFTYEWTVGGNVQSSVESMVVELVTTACDTMYVFSVDIEDANHCPSSATDTIVVRDRELPTISGDLEVVTYNGCAIDELPTAVATAEELQTVLGLTLNDNCTNVSEMGISHRDVVSGSCPTVVNRYYTVTDRCGNASLEFMQTLQVYDSVAPVVSEAVVETHLNGCDATAADAAVTTPQALDSLGFRFNDVCTVSDSLQVTYTETVGGSCPTTIVRKYVVTDQCGNVSDTMIHTITVFDSVRPVLHGTIADTTVDGCDTTVLRNYPIATTAEALHNLGVTVEEECSDVTVSYTETVTGSCPTTVTRTYTVTDACGNVSNEVSQVIIIQDTTRPVFTEEIDTQSLTGTGGHFYVPDFSSMVSQIISDDCTPDDQITIAQNPAAGTEVTQNLVVTVTITDSCHNMDSTTIQVVIPDALSIRIRQPDARFCFGDSVVLTPVVDGGSPDYVFAWTPADGLNADNIQNVTASPAPGIYHYVVTVTDANGSTASDDITVTVDSIPATPTLIPEGNTICNGANGIITVTAPIGEGYSYSLNGGEYQTEPVFSGLSVGSYTVMVRTEAGCESEPAEIAIENDINVPSVTLVAPDTLLCPNIGTQEVTAEITGGTEPFTITWGGDAVQVSTTDTTFVTVDPAQCNRMYIITFEMTDVRNCATSATDTIFVSDEVLPTIDGMIEVVTYNGCTEDDAPSAVTTPAGLSDTLGLTLADNCTAPEDLTVTSRDEVSGSCPIVINRYYRVTDRCGNASPEFMQTLQVYDSVAPVVSEAVVETHRNGCDATAADAAVTTPQELQDLGFVFSDVCTMFDSLQISYTETIDSICPIIITRKYVVEDKCGNVSDTMTHTITVFDSVAPVITGAIADTTLDGCDTIVLTQRPAVTTVAELVALGGIAIQETCSEAEMTVQSSQTVTPGCPITVVRTYRVIDRCGNVSNAVTETIYIQDTVAPAFASQVEEHLLTSATCQFVVPDLTEEVRAVSSDNCTTIPDSLVITQNPVAGTPVTADMTVDVTVADACNNRSVMTISLRLPETITLDITPSTTQYCEWDTVALSAVPAGGDSDYTYEWTPATGLNSTTDSVVYVATENQQYAYSVTVTDGNGCAATASYTLPEPSHLSVTAAVQSEINCYQGSDGVAVATATNGVEDYNYVWSNGTTTATNSNLAEGTYTVTVTDAYGCTVTTEITLNHPTQLAATVSDETAVLCFGDANGSGTVTPDGGTAPYTVSIDNNATTYAVAAGANYTFAQLTAGTYTVLVTDANGCPTTTTLTVTSPELLRIAAGTITMPLCNQGNNGSAVVNVTGGTLPYTLSVNGTEVATMTAEGDQQIDNLSAGTYTVSVVDANGCDTLITITVAEPELLTLTEVSTENVSCNALSDATATVTFAGGTAPYTLYINGNDQETAAAAVQNVTFTGLPAGTHTVGIRDANGCVTTLPVTITEPDVLTMTAGSIVDVLCFGDANGSAVVTPTGGTAPYTITVDNFTTTQTVAGGATGTFANLTAGDYTAAVRDANGCEDTVSFTIGTPTVLEMVEVSTTDPLCYQDANGSIVVNVVGGTAPYSITVNGTSEATNLTAGDHTISGRPAGSYTIVATDANGCTATVTSVLGEPAQLTPMEAATTPITCFGGDDGTATVSVSGGTAGYSIWMDDNQQLQTLSDTTFRASFTGLNGGDHVFTVKDTHNCVATLTITFIEPDPMNRVLDTITDVVCYGQNSGTATVTISGGTLPYVMTVADNIPEITLNTEDPYTITGLWAATYTISIVDAHGCTAQMEITVQQPDSLSAIASVLNNVDCFGTLTGAATVLPEGGIPPYTYNWTGDRTEQTVDSLAAGRYYVTVTDANGCTASDSTNISEPEDLTITLITLTESCNGEETAVIEVEASGGTPEYTLLWNNGMEGSRIENLVVGTYTVTVTDQHNCFDTLAAVVPFHALPDFTVSVTPAYCGRADGTATVVGSNLGNYTYNWNTEPNPNAPVNDELLAGDYVLVVDDGVCTLALPFTIDHIPGPTAIFNANPTSFMEGHTVRFNDFSIGSVVTWVYDFGDGGYAHTQTASHEYNEAGEYWVVLTVTDRNNCVDTAMTLITVVPDVVIYIPNAFTPNDNGVNDVWMPVISNYGNEFYEVIIYSRWGEMVFKSNDPHVGWNGKVNGKTVEAGVFTYRITYSDVFNKKYIKTGTVTVVR